MARYGIPEDDIAIVVGIDAKTLRKHFRLELDVAFVKANAQGGRIDLPASRRRARAILPGRPSRCRQADAGRTARACSAAGIWWERTRGGRSEYAPLRPKPLGKKEAARLAAANAARGTDWSELVDESRAN